MPTPSPTTYESPVSKVGGGREIFPNASLDLIAATPERGWVRACGWALGRMIRGQANG